ncbi:MazG nucleotide pyrophosphohydrolase domain-containing protein [Flexivirga caeni]|nr:MazG nucleotide pyrophosphohydrolase domain-containing protein [Flexivirga caeni]
MERAKTIRALYAADEARRFGRSWTVEEVALGFVGDVGDLAKLVQSKAGVRHHNHVDEAIAHELADCLWSVLVLADAYGVDLEASFTQTMTSLETHLQRSAAGADIQD